MGNLEDYFKRTAYDPKYHLGDRVFGRWNKIPFVGSVGNDRVVGTSGPEITVHLDLPIKYNNTIHHIVVVKHKDIKLLKEM